MVRTQIQLTEEQAKELKRIAAKEGVSVAEVVRRSVDTTIRAGAAPGREEIKRRALAAIGSVRGGVRDMSVRHDDYLADAYAE